MDEQTIPIQIKGLRDGLLISIGDGEWATLEPALFEYIDSQDSFFRGARIALDVGAQKLKVNDLVSLRDKLSEHEISLWAVMSESALTEKTAQLLGLATRISKPRPEQLNQFSVDGHNNETALFLDRTLRSGMRIEYPGHIVVTGDVNPGAEIIAEGNVLVWGRVRGMIHAGAKGDNSAYICALALAPTHLRIAEVVSGKLKKGENQTPVIVKISKDGKLKFVPWQPE
ncbi:MAG: septum site-determining protein MinC [Anaerolineae bacterium]|nr:septum site-determining protein MinC [Anaerolineae bacterium]MDK1080448.1 septum site-determining protein MinC [Anaerolineae bacterium]MDK1119051.1 septum site-determining protein MinC [Anaerolineae bacterium]